MGLKIILSPQSKFNVVLPLPPSVNHLFASVPGKRVKSREYKGWIALAVPMLLELRRPKTLPAEVRFCVFGKVNPARDLDNFLKPLGDALVLAKVIPGDSIKYVTEWRIGYGGEWDAEPGVMVEVISANPEK